MNTYQTNSSQNDTTYEQQQQTLISQFQPQQNFSQLQSEEKYQLIESIRNAFHQLYNPTLYSIEERNQIKTKLFIFANKIYLGSTRFNFSKYSGLY